MENRKNIFFIIALSILTCAALTFSFISSPNGFVKGYTETKYYTFVLDNTNYDFLPSSMGSGQSTNENSPRTTNGNPIIFSYNSTYKNASRIRMYKNSGSISNVTPFSGLRAITVQIPSGSATLSYGSSYSNYSETINITNGVRYEINRMPYFKITAGNSTAYLDSVTVEYVCDGTGELDPITTHTHNGYHYLAKEPTTYEPGNKEFYACKDCEYVSLVKEDEGTYVDTVLTYELPSDHIAYIAPSILKMPAQFSYPIAVNAEIPSTTYAADKTGQSDASTIIQTALNDVANLGGGTVYISSGKYLLNNQLSIPSRVTLVGEFNGPSAQDYGTVLLCNKSHDGTDSILDNAQIVVRSNASINGFTFFYPNQNINSVVRYGHTIYFFNNLAANASNLFFINSYSGIAVNDVTEGAGELVSIENIYGTFLSNGLAGYYQSDAAGWNNIHISPSYYANAISEYRCSNSSALYKYTRTNLTAMTLGDLDDFTFDKIYIDNANTGIYFPIEVNRELQAFWGSLNDVNISECLTGVYATGIFSGGAALFTHSSLGKIVNISEKGVLKLSKCQYDELLGPGNNMVESGAESYEASPSHDDSHTFNIPAKAYYVDSLDDTGATDVSAALQAEINKVNNGGVVILKNGTYRLNNPITLPSNTMITSFGNAFSRTTGHESKLELVKFISYSDDACVKLNSNSGINGIRIYNVYRDPDYAYNKLSTSNTDSYVAVKALGNGCFALNSEVTFAFTAFDFSNSTNHYIKRCCGSAYETFVKASGSGKVIDSLTNFNFLGRNCLYEFAQENISAIEKYYDVESDSKEAEHIKLRDDITRTFTTMIKITGGSEQVLSSFSYGIKTLIESNDANLLAINTSQDNLKDESYMYIINGGDAKIVNSLRVFGHSFNLISGHLEAYGRFDFKNKFEKYFNSSSSSTDDPISPLTGLSEDVLSYCESTSGVSGASRNSSTKYQGSYSWRASSTSNPAISYSFSSKNISQYMAKGYLRFYVYCSNISVKGTEYTVELTSGGTCDADEIYYHVDDQITKQGWNEIILKLSDYYVGPDSFNPAAANYFRFFALNTSGYYYVDYISFFHEPIPTNQIVISNCDILDNSGSVSLSEFRMEGTHSYKTNDSVNTTVVYNLSATNISSYMSTGSLSFYLYVLDQDKLGDYVFVELTSSGIWDNEEITCNVKPYIIGEGWVHVEIPLNVFYASGSGTFDSTRFNFFRLYTLNSDSYFYIDDIRLIK